MLSGNTKEKKKRTVIYNVNVVQVKNLFWLGIELYYWKLSGTYNASPLDSTTHPRFILPKRIPQQILMIFQKCRKMHAATPTNFYHNFLLGISIFFIIIQRLKYVYLLCIIIKASRCVLCLNFLYFMASKNRIGSMRNVRCILRDLMK